MAATATVGLQLEVDPKIHDWNIHLNRLEQFFIANAFTDDSIKRAILLNGLVQEAYILLQNLCLPTKPSDASYKDLIKHLNSYFGGKTIVFAESTSFMQHTNLQTKVCKIGL